MKREPDAVLRDLDSTLWRPEARKPGSPAAGLLAEADALCSELYATLATAAKAPRWGQFPEATTYYRMWVRRVGRE